MAEVAFCLICSYFAFKAAGSLYDAFLALHAPEDHYGSVRAAERRLGPLNDE